MMLLRFVTLIIVATWSSGLMAHDAQIQMQAGVIVKEHDGTPRLRFGLREAKPKQWPDSGDVHFFFRRHDVKDAAGRVVTGLGFIGWKQGPDARIAVFTLVPKAGAPNAFLAASPETTRNLRLEPFDEFTLAPGKSMSVDKVKVLGVEPAIVVFEVAQPRLVHNLAFPRGAEDAAAVTSARMRR